MSLTASAICSAFPSPQGGSETLDGEPLGGDLEGFHPLKAGRRLYLKLVGAIPRRFPSPQGGSETGNAPKRGEPLPLFPSPQGGSETPS